MLGRKIKLPFVETKLKFKKNPLHQDQRVKDYLVRLHDFTNMSKEKSIKLEETTKFVQYFHPFVCKIERYIILEAIMYLFFVLDDHSECDWGDFSRKKFNPEELWEQVNEALDRILFPDRHISMAKWKPYVVAFYFIWEDMCQDYNQLQKVRYVKTFREYVQGNLMEIDITKDLNRFENIEQLLDVRKSSIGMKICFQKIEYADELILSDAEWDDPTMQKYLDIGCINVVLHNDIASFEKEIKEQNGQLNKCCNCVALTMLIENCSAEKAIEKTVQLVYDFEKQFLELKQELLAREGNTRDVITFLEKVEYAVGGHFVCTFKLERYSRVSPTD